jgi:hypothetical protein
MRSFPARQPARASSSEAIARAVRRGCAERCLHDAIMLELKTTASSQARRSRVFLTRHRTWAPLTCADCIDDILRHATRADLEGIAQLADCDPLLTLKAKQRLAVGV